MLAGHRRRRGRHSARFAAGVDLTTFGVTVVDRKGNIVTASPSDDFEVLEDGKPQAVELLRRRATATPLRRMHLGLMLDASGSMETDLKLRAGAAIKFLNMLPDAEDITLVDFDTAGPHHAATRSATSRGWSSASASASPTAGPRSTMRSASISMAPIGRTGRKILVMYTDGGDTRSALRSRETLTLLKASHVTVYAIGLVENTGSARARAADDAAAAGRADRRPGVLPEAMKDVESAYDKVLAEIKGQYHLGYRRPTRPPTAPGARSRSRSSVPSSQCGRARATSAPTRRSQKSGYDGALVHRSA